MSDEYETGYGDDWDKTRQYQYWFATWNNPPASYRLDLSDQSDGYWRDKDISYSRGQLEKGESGTIHWQFIVYFKEADKKRLLQMKKMFGSQVSWRPCKSEKVEAYVWKDDTSLGHRWEWGKRPMKRNSKTDYNKVKKMAKLGDLDHEDIPADVYVRMYGNLKKIAMDNMKAEGLEKEVNVYFGKTEMGKSRKAWAEATWDAYPKTPTTKFWDGYQGQENVVIDEFFGQIEISHMLRWLDRYPILVETKGSGVVLRAKKIWITTNIHPRDWYPSAHASQRDALMRRLKITEFVFQWFPPSSGDTQSPPESEHPSQQSTQNGSGPNLIGLSPIIDLTEDEDFE